MSDANALTAAQLLDKTIEAMVAAGPEGWCRGVADHGVRPRPVCTMNRAMNLLGVKQAMNAGPDWHRASRRLGFGNVMDLNDSAESFDDCIDKLRRLKAAL